MAGDTLRTPAIRRIERGIFGLSIYRLGVHLAFLMGGFSAFPDNKTFVALSLITFGLGISAILETQQLSTAIDYRLIDAGERKTRYTIAVAQEWALRREPAGGYPFWADVNDRVADEMDDDPESTALKWWQSTLLVLWNPIGRLLSDLVMIVIALILSGNG